MNKIKNVILIISIIALCILAFIFYNIYTKEKTDTQPAPVFSDEFVNVSSSFSDGLKNPDSVTQYPLDETGIGTSEKSVYYIDINKDKNPDRITKTFIETGNTHSYYEYKIELNVDGKYIDITPENLRTVNGTDCDLQQIQFVFRPQFKIILISRELDNTWSEPSLAHKQVFNIVNNKIESGKKIPLRKICDVKELF